MKTFFAKIHTETYAKILKDFNNDPLKLAVDILLNFEHGETLGFLEFLSFNPNIR